jgi:hypothetical protein
MPQYVSHLLHRDPVPWADVSKLIQTTLKMRKNISLSRPISRGRSSDDGSRSEETNREDDDEGVFRRLIPYLLPY